jgi:hypothetical protein
VVQSAPLGNMGPVVQTHTFFVFIVILAELQDVQKFGLIVAQVLHPTTGHPAAERIGLA